MSYRWSILALLSVLSACSSFDVLNSVTRSSHYSAFHDVVYAPQPRGQLDIYVPLDHSGPSPVLVFFYGGGWREGRRQDYEFVASELARAGIVVVLPDYRLHPDVAFPEFVNDAALAVRWALKHLPDYGIQPAGWYVGGHSAGAYIASMLALSPDYLGDTRLQLAGLIGLSGPYDFLPLEPGYLTEVFPQASQDSSQPIRFAGSTTMPTLLIHGDADKTVGVGNSQRLAAAMQAAGSPVQLIIYEDVAHARVVAAMASPLTHLAPTAADVVGFILGSEAARPSLGAQPD